MFYDIQPLKNKENYKNMLKCVGRLSNLFSESDSPYLSYRAHENIFCKYLEADNLARSDCSADAKKQNTGIGLKTWVGRDDQKVAEFGKLKKFYADLKGLDLVKKIAEYRNERIRVTKNIYGIDVMIYHVVKRIPNAMQILECAFDFIDVDNISMIPDKGNDNNTYFTDGKHTYHFSVSKNTLYMIFSELELMEEFEVDIAPDPYELLTGIENFYNAKEYGIEFVTDSKEQIIFNKSRVSIKRKMKEQLCLPLYSIKGKEKIKYVPEKSGINQWNAGGRVRDVNELYIPYQSKERKISENFFPSKDTSFTLHLPNGTDISAKMCQEVDKKNPLMGKAIMSNPNKVLGKWLLRDVFELPEKVLVTYEMLEKFGIDSVIFTKNSNLDYSIDFAEIGTYEEFYGIEDHEDKTEDI